MSFAKSIWQNLVPCIVFLRFWGLSLAAGGFASFLPALYIIGVWLLADRSVRGLQEG